MTTPTPGPWTANLDSDHGDFIVWGPRGNDDFVANVGTEPEKDGIVAFDVTRANALLIARAPDLRAEVERLTKERDDYKAKLCCDESPECVHVLAWSERDIFKARVAALEAALNHSAGKLIAEGFGSRAEAEEAVELLEGTDYEIGRAALEGK